MMHLGRKIQQEDYSMTKDKIIKLTEAKEKLLEMEKYFQVVPEYMDFKEAIDTAVASLEEDIAEEQKMYDYYLRTGDESIKVYMTKKDFIRIALYFQR